MKKSLEYAPESVEPDEKGALALLKQWRELFGDDEVSTPRVIEELRGIHGMVNDDKVRKHLQYLEKEKLIESVERNGEKLYQRTMGGIRVAENEN